MSRGVRPVRLTDGVAAWLLAVLALVSELTLGAMVLPDDAVLQQFERAGVLCQADAPPQHPDNAPHRRVPDPALCPLSVALALPAVCLSPVLALSSPALRPVLRQWATPPTRAPPSHVSRIGFPRGPPILA